MSANDHTTAHEEDHSGPIKTPQQLLWTVIYSFVIPVFAIIALVYFVASANKPGAGGDISAKFHAAVSLNTQCAACHNSGAAGAPKSGDVAAWAPRLKTGFESLWNSVLKGKGAMGAQGGGDFSDVEIGRAVVYLTSKAGGKFSEPAAPAAAAAEAAAK